MTVVHPPREVSGGAAPPPGRPAPAPPVRATVAVAGVGSAVVTPDALRLELAVESAESTVVDAMRVARTTMAEVRRVVSGVGVAEEDQRTSGLSIHPRYEERTGGHAGYVASESLTVTLRDPDRIDAVLTEAADVAGDLLRVGGLGFMVTDQSAAEDEARVAAVAEARRRARLYAAELDADLGPLVRLVERGGGADEPMEHGRMAAMQSAAVEPGTHLVRMQVTAEWTLLPARATSGGLESLPAPAGRPSEPSDLPDPAPSVDPR